MRQDPTISAGDGRRARRGGGLGSPSGTRLLALVALIGLGRPPAARAGTLCVNSGGTGGCYPTIVAAVTAAVSGDTIQVAAGLYCGYHTFGKNLTLVGAGAGSTIVDGQGVGTPCSGTVFANTPFTINSGVTATLSGLTIQHGGFGDGGGIYNFGTLTLTNVTLSNNTAANGGGIFNASGATLTLTNVILSGNTAVAEGGGIDNLGTATLTNVTLSGNSAIFEGGGIFNDGTTTLTNVTLSGNSATAKGGGIANQGGTAKLTNVTLSGNTAPGGNGGGIFNTLGTLALQASIVANNGGGGDCVSSTPTGILTSQGGNVADDGSCHLTGPQDKPGANPLLSPLASNGGFTQTMALQPGSPAIDNVPTSLCPPPATDQRGVTRPQGAACDSGAFEAGGAPPTATSTPGCGSVTYLTGWNLAGGPQGTVLTGAAALFSLPAGAQTYTSLQPGTALTGPGGVWAFYFSATTVTLPCVTAASTTLSLAAGQTTLAGNPFDTAATLSATGGPTFAITFNTATNSYPAYTRIDSDGTLTLPPGQAAFVVPVVSTNLTLQAVLSALNTPTPPTATPLATATPKP